ncbi:hypothetical protein CC80DRAFT_15406 [Byssothecium circinans]|uniref:Uncharacterized protein n=1 Tax=Byssothecium circinans TaxID=147558 RepID=A0A6A5U2R5_9PLEO|nr:hypothetical protein CC80DRAFT_15406 [Byssothecium circinans]
MTLSCNPRGMLALLRGSFSDMAIECNKMRLQDICHNSGEKTTLSRSSLARSYHRWA